MIKNIYLKKSNWFIFLVYTFILVMSIFLLFLVFDVSIMELEQNISSMPLSQSLKEQRAILFDETIMEQMVNLRLEHPKYPFLDKSEIPLHESSQVVKEDLKPYFEGKNLIIPNVSVIYSKDNTLYCYANGKYFLLKEQDSNLIKEFVLRQRDRTFLEYIKNNRTISVWLSPTGGSYNLPSNFPNNLPSNNLRGYLSQVPIKFNLNVDVINTYEALQLLSKSPSDPDIEVLTIPINLEINHDNHDGIEEVQPKAIKYGYREPGNFIGSGQSYFCVFILGLMVSALINAIINRKRARFKENVLSE